MKKNYSFKKNYLKLLRIFHLIDIYLEIKTSNIIENL